MMTKLPIRNHKPFYESEIPDQQKKIAERARKLNNKESVKFVKCTFIKTRLQLITKKEKKMKVTLKWKMYNFPILIVTQH